MVTTNRLQPNIKGCPKTREHSRDANGDETTLARTDENKRRYALQCGIPVTSTD